MIKQKRLLKTLINLILTTTLLLTPFIIGLLFTPKLIDIHSQFNTELPKLTSLYINLINLFKEYWFFIIPILIITSLILTTLSSLLFIKKSNKNLEKIYYATLLILLGLTIGFITTTIYIPIFSLAKSF